MRIRWIDAALATLVLATALVRPACARPQYYQQIGRPCSHCHTEPFGGTDLTSTGREYGHSCTPDGVDATSIAAEPSVPDKRNRFITSRPSPPTTGEPDTHAGKTGLLAVGFGITSFCLLAYRRSR